MSSDSSSSTAATMHRKYVDPWDLDLRDVSWRHSSDTTDCSADQVVSLSSAAGPESARSDFVYVPGSPPNSKTTDGGDDDGTKNRARYDCCPQCSPEKPLRSAVLPPAPPPTESYVYWEPSTCGRKVRPSPPPPYGYAVDDRFHPAGTSNRCLLYNVSRPDVRRNSRYNNTDVDSVCRSYEICSSEYDPAENVITSQFRYNTLGHMKIDYSSNWNNLDKYICRV